MEMTLHTRYEHVGPCEAISSWVRDEDHRWCEAAGLGGFYAMLSEPVDYARVAEFVENMPPRSEKTPMLYSSVGKRMVIWKRKLLSRLGFPEKGLRSLPCGERLSQSKLNTVVNATARNNQHGFRMASIPQVPDDRIRRRVHGMQAAFWLEVELAFIEEPRVEMLYCASNGRQVDWAYFMARSFEAEMERIRDKRSARTVVAPFLSWYIRTFIEMYPEDLLPEQRSPRLRSPPSSAEGLGPARKRPCLEPREASDSEPKPSTPADAGAIVVRSATGVGAGPTMDRTPAALAASAPSPSCGFNGDGRSPSSGPELQTQPTSPAGVGPSAGGDAEGGPVLVSDEWEGLRLAVDAARQRQDAYVADLQGRHARAALDLAAALRRPNLEPRVARLEADVVRARRDSDAAKTIAERATAAAARASAAQTALQGEIAVAKALLQEAEEISAARQATVADLRGTLRGERTAVEQLRLAQSTAASEAEQLRLELESLPALRAEVARLRREEVSWRATRARSEAESALLQEIAHGRVNEHFDIVAYIQHVGDVAHDTVVAHLREVAGEGVLGHPIDDGDGAADSDNNDDDDQAAAAGV